MYARNINRNAAYTTPLPQKREYKCKVCYDAGKSAQVYNSHFVRATPDIRSKVVCPTLLAIVCGYCHKKGHTPSRCLKRERDESTISSACDGASTMSWDTNSTSNMYCRPTNLYSLLCDQADDDEDDRTISTFETEVLPASSNAKSSYLLALLRPAAEVKPQEPEPVPVKTFPLLPDLPVATRRMVFSKSWADWSDSEDEDD